MKGRDLLALGALVGCPIVTYAGYPALVWVAALLRPCPPVTRRNFEPSVTVVIAAHNEAALIGAKVRNVMELDYPSRQISVVVVCDGCTDETANAARAAGDSRLTVIELLRQRGKLAAIRAAIAHVGSDYIAFTDANAMLDGDALRHLVAPFADPTVVAVSGAKHVRGGPEAFYWRYERWLRTWESVSGSIAGADGALYAVRAAAIDASPKAGAADDLLISLRAAREGGRIAFAPRARTAEAASPSATGTLASRARTTSGALFALESLPELLQPGCRDLWWKLAGHKLLRIATPPAMVAGAIAFAGPKLAWGTRPLAGAAGFALLATLVAIRFFSQFGRLTALMRYAVLANLAALVGLGRYISRRPIDAWTPARERDSGPTGCSRRLWN